MVMHKVQVNGVVHQAQAMENLRLFLERIGHAGHGLCHDEKIISSAKCDLCLVKMNGEMARSCENFVTDEMVIETKDEELTKTRQQSFELLGQSHSTDCERCHQSGLCQLQSFARENTLNFAHKHQQDASLPLFEPMARGYGLNHERCISCSLCVDYSQKVLKDELFFHRGRGAKMMVGFEREALEQSDLGFYRDLCPTGAIAHQRDFRLGQKGTWHKLTCSGCQRACELDARTIDDRYIDIRSSTEFPEKLACESGRNWWGDIDLWQAHYPLAIKNADQRMMPMSKNEIKLEQLENSLDWHILLPTDLTAEEAKNWHAFVDHKKLSASIFRPAENDFLYKIGPEGLFVQNHDELSSLPVIEELLPQYHGLVVVEPLWRLKFDFLQQLGLRANRMVLFSSGPLLEDVAWMQVDRNTWTSSPLLPARQTEAIQGIMDLLIS